MRIPFDQMKIEFKRILLSKGFREQDAEHAALSFTNNSCEGVYTHGVNRFPKVVENIDKGFIKADTKPELVNSLGAVEQWDGKLGLGSLVANQTMKRAMELASEYGIGCVALRNNNHWMRGGEYGWQAANNGYVGICWTNTIPNMPAWGAQDNRIGNNPLIIAIPRDKGSIVVDLAMSQFSYGKLEQFRLQSKDLPVPGGYDRQGNTTQDPAEIEKTGRVLPIGFWNGSSLSIVLDLLAATLSGGNTTKEIGDLGDGEYAVSQVFIAISAEKLGGAEERNRLLDESIDYIKSSVPAEAEGEIYYPGERAQSIKKDNLKNGIPVDERVWEKIKSL